MDVVIQSVVDNVLVPGIMILGAVILIILRSYANKIVNSIVAKNNNESIARQTESAANVINEIDKIVEAAVAANMDKVKKLKEEHGTLTKSDIDSLRNNVRKSVYRVIQNVSNKLPADIMTQTLGDNKSINMLINELLEKHVTTQKLALTMIESNRTNSNTIAPSVESCIDTISMPNTVLYQYDEKSIDDKK